MKVDTVAIDDLLSPIKSYFQNEGITHQDIKDKPPLRSELFSTEQMDQHAQHLASIHSINYKQSTEKLLKRLADNKEILFHVNELLQKNIKEKKSISPAGEWLLDNFYLIEEEIRTAKRYLPKGYSKELPKLNSGALAGFPRVYDIAIEIISHSDGHVDINSLSNFISGYQKINYLTLGELWAVPIMIRLALLENLSRMAARIAVDRMDTALAHQWSSRMLETAEKNPKNLVLVIADMARSNPPLGSAFVAEFARKLQWKGAELSLPLSWVEQNLAGNVHTINAMVLEENRKQAADQVSVSNSINSLRFQSKMDWREFVETMSAVEQTLRKDVNDVYTKMDFFTRDHYRHRIEKMAKTSPLSEIQMAKFAIELAHASYKNDSNNQRKAHVGYYLCGPGTKSTQKKLGVRLSYVKSVREKLIDFSHSLYIAIALCITLLVGGAMIMKGYVDGLSTVMIIPIGILSLLAASHLALALSNWWITIWIKPNPLPKLDFSKGIPNEDRTMVVVPTLIINVNQVEKLIEDLEVRYLANPDPNLLFALLTDFNDASSEIMPEDDELLMSTRKRIEELNKQHGRSDSTTFFLFHRPRRWNAVGNAWMGYERKRGKLSELNQLLRGKSNDQFMLVVGDERIYTTVKYVITLDTDTQLPRDAGWKLVGLMAHPLNHPLYDEKKRRVVEGYGIVQPRIAISLHGATRSGYTRLHENDSGIDPYTRVTSDVYQDIFDEGSFIGKGIYEVDSFEKALNNRFPENRILSHDLLEGCYARCGFASDVQLYEEYPSRYSVDMNRRHRWIRGDWQIGNWFLPFVPGADRKFKKNSISALSRWKIFDNLRRSILPIALVVLLIAGWTVLPSSWFWTIAVMLIIILPSVITSAWSAMFKPKEIGITQHIHNSIGSTSKSVLQALFTFLCLPYEAYVSMDAIMRTLWRVYISRKKLLEWNPSGFLQNENENILITYRTMWIAPILSIGVFAFLYWNQSLVFFIAAPFLLLWIFSPAIVSLLSQPVYSSKTKLKDDQKEYLRLLARKTWSFFENFVTAEDNYLPPDNFQYYPIPVVAHRTSPTNIGLSLLANLAACDFGYSTTSQLIDRTTHTFDSLEKLERHEGHFFNWYDTQSLQTLYPKYISTVDSGNLAGHLLTLRQGLIALTQQKITGPIYLSGLQDTLCAALDTVTQDHSALRLSLQRLYSTLYTDSPTLPFLKSHFENILKQFQEATANLSFNLSDHERDSWLLAFEQHVKSLDKEITTFAPWLDLLPIPEKFKEWKMLSDIPTFAQLARMDREIIPELAQHSTSENTVDEDRWLAQIEGCVRNASKRARENISVLQNLASRSLLFADMEYEFLYDKSQHLLAIGYNTNEHQRDTSYYDLLASEARLSSFVAIAQGKLPQESWFALGRRLTTAGNTSVLLSWSGSMFEYLMPLLVMPTYENTLLDEMCIGSVKKQIEYGEQQGVPWGISESCYNVVDAHLTYQYRAFGIPGLGFKRGLGHDLVIAPYATVLALMVEPVAAYTNLERMKNKGFEGRYGFYEAVDYTPIRLSRGQTHAVIQTFMAHHQGMSLLSLAYLLLDKPMQRRFESDTQFQTALLLLQEQVPKSTGFYLGSEVENVPRVFPAAEIRVLHTSNTPIPEIQLLSNGRYHVMLTNAGGGYSRWRDLAINRWREDTTCDDWGTFCFIRNTDKGESWSTTHQPTLKEAAHYEAIFSQDRVEYRRRDDEVETYSIIIVSPEDDVEVRRVHLTNHSKTKRNLEITSYGEIVLALPAADDSHPAFSNLFVQTEINSSQHAIVCTRRPRSKDERPPWMFHLMKVDGIEKTEVSYETDRSKFIGRGNTIHHPNVIFHGESLSGSQGSVLDPIVSIRHLIKLESGEAVTIDMVTGISDTREGNQSLIDKYQDRHLRDRAFELSLTHSQVVLRQIGATESEVQLYGKLASSILYLNSALRAPTSVLMKNQRGQSALWSYSISGDLPIVLLHVSDTANIGLVKQLIKAQAYWQSKGLATDLVILNEDPSGYRQVLQEQIQSLIASISTTEKQGKIVVRPADQVPAEDRILLQTVARIILSDTKGTLADQVNKRVPEKTQAAKFIPTKFGSIVSMKSVAQRELQFYNGLGGFSPDGKEYVITTKRNKLTPLPWSNVIANPNFGTIVTESGSSYTWFENAHEYRLTPWKNDPVTDGCGEAFYLRDEETGHYWSPMALPSTSESPYVTRHGFGYSIFEHTEDGIRTEVCMYTDIEAPIKFVVITVRNQSDRSRKLSATGYAEWVLGGLPSKSVMHVVTELDTTSGALIAKNIFNTEFQNYVAFFDVDDPNYYYTTDRTEFIGRNGTLQHPEAMNRTQLSGKAGAGMDACAAIQIPFELENGKERKLIFKIGAGKDLREAVETVQRFQGSQAASKALQNVHEFWQKTLGNVHVETPDSSINLLANGWLLYQVLSCRVWGRSGFYQSGGAFGFRDQLQDVMSLAHTLPHVTRKQIVTAASRQFTEGDVQHWWHPPMGRGVRTLCSDDFLWLPFVTSRYINLTGDTAVLDESIPFLQGRRLNVNEESYYDLPITSDRQATLYEHCKQAIEHGLRFGEHGLPLMGSGDWNDGMNMVGIHGKGESVWLAFFLYDVMNRFIKIAALHADTVFVTKMEKQASKLKKNIQSHAWDGEWYLRAYFDDGTPIGSSRNTECRIDAIAQSWSVLSEAGETHRSLTAMQSANQYLINREKGLIQLLEPPFDKTDLDPGYIKGYVPGVRENGGQYTHAAIWMVMAFAKLKDRERTSELLNLINPINHAKTSDDVAVYKAEPYVIAADVYGVAPHVGRGGWTWYTGSAGWMYQLILESFLGIKREGETLRFEPCIPIEWKSFKVKYTFKETHYYIEIHQEEGDKIALLIVDDILQQDSILHLINDAIDHHVLLKLNLNGVEMKEKQ